MNIRLAIRSLRRSAFFSAINITGLAVGLAACWLTALYVLHERSFDRFIPHSDRIYAVALDLKMGDQEGITTNTPPPLGIRMAADYSEIETVARTFSLGNTLMRRESPGQAPLIFSEKGALAADTGFLALFEFPLLHGDNTALNQPGSMVLTEAAATKYFGKTDVVGQSLSLNDRAFTIRGVLQNLPENSSLQFDFLLPMADFRVVERFSWSWVWLQVDTWVRLRQPADNTARVALENKFRDMVRRYAPDAFERIGQDFNAQMAQGDRYNVRLLPLTDLHLQYPELASRLVTVGDGQQVQTFALIGALILLLACVNFMNLSTARSARRAREVGVRKALGSQRSQLVGQFLGETLVFSVVAMAGAAVLARLALPGFNTLTGLEKQSADLFAMPLALYVAALPLLTTLLGGLYPAFFLSRFKASEVIKSRSLTAQSGHGRLRSALVVFQFAVSVALMLGTFVVMRQVGFARQASPGMQREHVLYLDNVRLFPSASARETFRQQLLQMPEVEQATHASFLPSIGSFGDFYEPEQGGQSNAVVNSLLLSSYLTDDGFVPALGMEMLAGRNFLPQSTVDSQSVILNESAVKAIGWQNPIGQWLRYPGNQNQRFQVVGVVRDFHIGSIRTAIEPVAIFYESSKTYRTWGSYLALRLKPGAAQSAIEKTAAMWATALPGAPFEYDFLDASFANLYRMEARTGAVLGVLTALAMLIGCLGLFALAAYTAEQRTKEIGVRKVLGATVLGVTTLLTRDFLKLVVLALCIGLPLAWYYTRTWLQGYAYRIEVAWWYFALAAVAALLIAVFTVSVQSVRAAMANPVDTLRGE